MGAEANLLAMGIGLPDRMTKPFAGNSYGPMRPFVIYGNVLSLSGNVAEIEGRPIYPGRLGENVTLEQGELAARIAGMNVLSEIRYALGSLDRVRSVIRTTNFVACAPHFVEVSQVVNGFSNLLAEIFGPEIGTGCRASIGVQSLASGFCFETIGDFLFE